MKHLPFGEDWFQNFDKWMDNCDEIRSNYEEHDERWKRVGKVKSKSLSLKDKNFFTWVDHEMGKCQPHYGEYKIPILNQFSKPNYHNPIFKQIQRMK